MWMYAQTDIFVQHLWPIPDIDKYIAEITHRLKISGKSAESAHIEFHNHLFFFYEPIHLL